MTEAELINLVIDFAHQRQPAIYVLHFPDSRRIQGDPGLPDLLLLGEYQLIWRELKCDGTELRRHQRAWRWRLTSAGQDSYAVILDSLMPSEHRLSAARCSGRGYGRYSCFRSPLREGPSI